MKIIKFNLALWIFVAVASAGIAQIKVSDNKKFLATTDGQPFFWLGDTDWEMFHRLTRKEAEEVMEVRKQQGFNVLQVVALAEFNGLHGPNRYGDLPLLQDDPAQLAITPGNDPSKPDEYDYWDHVDFIINKAAEKGLYIGLLPTWGDKVAHMRGDGPIIFNEQNAEVFGATLAGRYKKQWNVLWILGGDRPVSYKSNLPGNSNEYNDAPIWRAMAKGIESVAGSDVFITYHTAGGSNSTSQYLQNEKWLDINTIQSSHGQRETEAWSWLKRDLSLKPQKPSMDMEPCYEDHPMNPWDGKWTRKGRGYFTAYDVRARIYRGIFAGGCGVTYGHHQVWQFLNRDLYEPITNGDTIIGWQKALHAEAAVQMQYLKELMLSRPYFSRIEDQSIIAEDPGKNYVDLVLATRDEDRQYAMIYLPMYRSVTVKGNAIDGKIKNSWWFDPRTGKVIPAEKIFGDAEKIFSPPVAAQDWVLVIDNAVQKFPPPGRL